MSDERRAHERIAVHREFASFEELVDELLVDLSETGAFIRTKTPRPVGEEIRFRLAVVDGDLETLEGVGVVRRVQDDPPGMAVEFIELAAHSTHLLARIKARARR